MISMHPWNLFKSIFAISVLLCLPACNPNEFKGASDKSDESKPESAQPSLEVNEDDSVVAPENITGSYLACAVRKEASDSDPSIQLGCRLNGSDDQKVALDPYVRSMTWGFSPNESATISNLSADQIWHIYVDITASNRLEAEGIVSNSVISLSYETRIERENVTLQQPTPSTLRPIVDFDDFEAPAILEQGIAPETPGPL